MTKEEIKELMELFAKANVSKIKIKEQDGFAIELEKDLCCDIPAPVPVAPAPQPINVNVVNETKSTPSSNKPTINSPMVGTFYQAPSPGAAPFAKVGQTIKKGSTIAIIEAMKIMNEIEAEYDCRIVEVLVADGQPVEFGMPLFVVEKI
ncbi:acetyl-CoA carboxylase biotin carboxyl carrier protein [Campylobacter volucris]|uniref:Biotin carboxyl carrier protein of acetyl-CoA carboxylase n=1 Tax=Campylobacter volucris TaxID=1031542 RepID=A0AAE5YGT9_9BACT|nr:acetyl-CoA carboxylase biotin carboxyl carrier protein [Campylobacter volucris]AJC94571.1 acetyl-CoA carboxylase, biotin carboxyl carrier protein [Campylobacter volucris LMG 24379]KAB0578117.1 acetyl-CoA carboxylase biotin carboxyl carrier protein [Campylobacter volucris]QBL13077.1 acetyl-CoA carboxylase biotin carboxyl carrier protein [Campylobacter volucris]QEL08788.1 acetyl-CoA carboxylase, biotin carboxyl carrier protein [Campylobacter volucris]TXK71440.1 acetyl-CoA carboxylase biotin c